MKPGTKAYISREGGKILSDVIRLVMTKPKKASPSPESEEEAPSEEKTMVTTQEPAKPPRIAGESEKQLVVEEIANGTACDICSLDHISTCAGILEEANRFARREGVNNTEVIRRISICRQQLNALERDDANPQKLVELPPIERKIMERILPKAGKLRHRLNEIVSLETLEQVTAETQDLSDQFQDEIFHLRLKRELTKNEASRLSSEDKERVLKRAEELIEGV